MLYLLNFACTDADNDFSISRFSHRRHDDGENLVEMDDGGIVDVDFDHTAHSGRNDQAERWEGNE